MATSSRKCISLEEALCDLSSLDIAATEEALTGGPSTVRSTLVSGDEEEVYQMAGLLNPSDCMIEHHKFAASEEYSEAFDSILAWTKTLNCGLRDVRPEIAEYAEYFAIDEYGAEAAKDVVEIIMHIPGSKADSTKSVLSAFTLFHALNDTVDNLVKNVLIKYKLLGLNVAEDKADNCAMKVVGAKEYLLHRRVPIGYYEAITVARRIKEPVHFTLVQLEDSVAATLDPLVKESAASLVTSLNFKKTMSLQATSSRGRLLDEIFRGSSPHLFPDEAAAAPPVEAPKNGVAMKAGFDKPLLVSVEEITFESYSNTFGYFQYFESFQVEFSLFYNGELLGGPYPAQTVPSKQGSEEGKAATLKLDVDSINTFLTVATLPDAARIVFTLYGYHSSKSKYKMKAQMTPLSKLPIAGACVTLVDSAQKLSCESRLLGLHVLSDGEKKKSWRYKDKYKRSRVGEGWLSVAEAERASSADDAKAADEEDDEDPQYRCLREHDLRSNAPPGGDRSGEIKIRYKLNAKYGLQSLQVSAPTKESVLKVYSDIAESKKGKIDKNTIPTPAERAEIKRLEFAEPISELTMAEKGVLWQFRDYCSTNPALLPKFLRAVPWRDEKKVEEAHVLLYMWSPVRPSDALELLDVRYSDQLVREYAVDKLDELNDAALDVLLLQLVQVLKYEPYHDSALARLLVRRGLLAPLTVGQHLFWMLRSEVFMTAYRERFGLVLSIYLRECGIYREGLRSQLFVNEELRRIAEALKNESSSKRLDFMREQLSQLNSRLNSKKFAFAIDPKRECRRFIVDKCKVMSSKKLPLWLVLENADPAAEPYFTMFKCGDDLRQDQLTLQVLSIMDQLWRDGSGSEDGAASKGASADTMRESLGRLSSTSKRNIFNARKPDPYNAVRLKAAKEAKSQSPPKVMNQRLEKVVVSPSAQGARKDSGEEGASVFSRITGMLSGATSIITGGKEPAKQGSPSRSGERKGSTFSMDNPLAKRDQKIISEEYVEPLNLRMKIYKCCSTGYNMGMIEIVLNSTTLAQIHAEKGGMFGAFKVDTIVDYLKENNPSNKYDEVVDNFAKTCAAYCVGTYILGIGDRHSDNIMVDKAGHLFHIDFGHFLGNFKSKLGVKRERSPFVFLPEMAYVLEEHNSDFYEDFETKACAAYNLLRRRANLLINLFALMIPASMPELTSRADLEYFLDMLSLTLTEEQAKDKFLDEIENTLSDTYRKFDNMFHNWKHRH